MHIVDRYFKHSEFKVTNDKKDLFLFRKDLHQIQKEDLKCLLVAVGSKHNTKQLPKEKLLGICQNRNIPLF